MTFTARQATIEDYPLFVRWFPELRVLDPILTRDQFASRVLPNATILEDADGTPLGYASFRLYGATAHVAHVIVDPAARSRGAGRALMDDVHARVRAAGCSRWLLNVKQDNVAAIGLYERCGLAVEQEAWAVVTDWSSLGRLVGEAGATSAFAPGAEDDARVARAFGIHVERIAQLRAREGTVMAALHEAASAPERVVAFAAFDPGYPGIYPIHVARQALARPLLDALRPHAREERIALTVEGDRALCDALLSIGAKLDHAVYRMSASIG